MKSTQEITLEVQQLGRWIPTLREQVSHVVVGQKYLVDRLLLGLLANGHILLEGVPGLAKTLTVKTLAAAIHTGFQRLQFTPDLLPADLIGTLIYNPRTGEFSTKLGPIFSNLILADEINRAPAKVQSALLEAMQERQVTIGEQTYPLSDPFLVLATQNPIEHHGTYPLPESQLDRFILRIGMGYPSRDSEREIMEQHSSGRNAAAEVRPVMEADEVEVMQRAVEKVRVDNSLRDYALDIVERTRNSEQLTLGVSPRGVLMLQRAAQARAYLEGRDYCTPDDFKQLVMPVFAHRVVVNTRYAATQKKSTQAEMVLREIIEATPVPL